MGTDDGPTVAVCLVRDLMFAGKIRAAGVPARIVHDPAALATADGSHLIVDLNQDGALPAAVAWRQRTGRPVVGFVAHVDGPTIAAARAVGIDRVMARVAFAQQSRAVLPAPFSDGPEGRLQAANPDPSGRR